MKILIISDAWHPQVNGVVRTYMYLQEELKKDGHIVKIVGPADFKRRFPLPGYKEIELVLFPQRQLNAIIEEFQPDAVHLPTEGPLGWSARYACKKKNIHFTSSYHTQFPTYLAMRFGKYLPFLFKPIKKIGVAFIKKFHAASSAMFATTQSMTDELKSWGIKTPIFPLTRGIDHSIFYPADSDILDHLKKPVALYVGRIAIEKNLEEFLSMEWDGSKVIVGHGPSEECYRKKYPAVLFAGKKIGKELAQYYQSADLFVFPSRTDTFGIVLIEALACGLPVAAHPVTGPIDVITKDYLGALNENLSIACREALKNGTPEQRQQHILTHYTWEKAKDQFVEVINKFK